MDTRHTDMRMRISSSTRSSSNNTAARSLLEQDQEQAQEQAPTGVLQDPHGAIVVPTPLRREGVGLA